MDSMSLFSIVTVSIPDAILNVILIILLVDGRRYLASYNKVSIAQFFGSVIAFTVSSYLIRIFSPNLFISMVLSIASYVAILKLIYFDAFKFKKLLAGVIVFTLLYLVIEALLVVTPIIFIENSNINNIYLSDYKRLLYSLPFRLTQIICIITLIKWSGLKLFFRDYKAVKNDAIVILSILLLTEMGVICNFLSLSNTVQQGQKIMMVCELLALCTVNVLFVRFINNISNAIYYNCVFKKRKEDEENEK